jgi:hypothetical protein
MGATEMNHGCLRQSHRLFRERSGLWVRSGFLLAALAATSPSLAGSAFYSAAASYCNGNSWSCSYDRVINQSTPQAASVGYYAGAVTYAGLGGTAVANVAFDPGRRRWFRMACIAP